MLLSTLVPTFLHFTLLLASPLVMLVQASPKRTQLATALDSYDTAKNQEAILQNVAWHLARSHYFACTAATLHLLTLFGSLIHLIHKGGLADYILKIAIFAIKTARYLL